MTCQGDRVIKVAIVRGGSSKAIVVLRNELPRDSKARDEVILSLFGSPDIRQIDGLGGAQNLTSKLAIIGPPTRSDADVDYLFGQVQITRPFIDYRANCGNISSAIGPIAIQYGLVDAVEPVTTVRINQVNTRSIIRAGIPVKDGHVVLCGSYVVDGVPGSGARIDLDFSDSAGAILKKGLLPTGKVTESLSVPGVGKFKITIVDAANLVVFVNSEEVGLTGGEQLFDLENDKKLIERLEQIRGTAAEHVGLLRDWKAVDFETNSNPYVAIVKKPNTYKVYTTGKYLDEEDYDLHARLFANRIFHRAYPGTGTVATGVAARIPGTVVSELVPANIEPLRIGHPAGIIEISVQVKQQQDGPSIVKACYGRTARVLLEGHAFLRPDIASW